MMTPLEGLVTPSGLTSIPAGLETPEMIQLRKKKIEESMEQGLVLSLCKKDGVLCRIMSAVNPLLVTKRRDSGAVHCPARETCCRGRGNDGLLPRV